jgi:hypothetical protein
MNNNKHKILNLEKKKLLLLRLKNRKILEYE